jgi:osmotically-inducible protein OsmY
MKKLTNTYAVVAVLSLSVLAWTGCHSTGSQYDRSTGRYVDDKALTSRVEDALKDHPVYKLEQVEVRSYRGTVQLSGFVATENQKEEAGETASRVAGVYGLENNISVMPDPLRPEASSRPGDTRQPEDSRENEQSSRTGDQTSR